MKIELWVHSKAFGTFKARTLSESDTTTKGGAYRQTVEQRKDRAIKDLERELGKRRDFEYRIEVKEIK